MHRTMPTTALESKYRGLRMTADEYLDLPDDGHRYELIGGVVCTSPSPSFPHQRIATEIASQISQYIGKTGSGAVVIEVDVRLSDDIVCRPDVIYPSHAKLAQCDQRVTVAPDVIVEVVSPPNRAPTTGKQNAATTSVSASARIGSSIRSGKRSSSTSCAAANMKARRSTACRSHPRRSKDSRWTRLD